MAFLMHDPRVQVLLRIAAELYHRANSVSDHLDQIRSLETPEYRQIADTIDTALANIKGPPFDVFNVMEAIGDKQALPLLFNTLKGFAHWFAKTHELLVYLPSPGVLPETIAMLERGFGSSYDKVKPSVILGTLFNAFEFDFYEGLGKVLPDFRRITQPDEGKPVLQQPVCDRCSPVGWGILGHEMGHTLDRIGGISRRATDSLMSDNDSVLYRVLRNWAKELCADLIAAETLGPAAIMSLLSLEYCVYPLLRIHLPSHSHPTTMWRLETVRKFLNRKYGEDFLTTELEFYRSAWDYSLRRDEPDPQKQSEVRQTDRVYYECFILPLAKQLERLVHEHIPPGHTILPATVDRCTNRLERCVPIAAQGAERSELRKSLETYRKQVFPTKSAKYEQFARLVATFREDPLPISVLLLSAAKRREQLMGQAAELFPRDIEGSIEILRGQLTRSDARVIKSIGTQVIHEQVSASG